MLSIIFIGIPLATVAIFLGITILVCLYLGILKFMELFPRTTLAALGLSFLTVIAASIGGL